MWVWVRRKNSNLPRLPASYLRYRLNSPITCSMAPKATLPLNESQLAGLPESALAMLGRCRAGDTQKNSLNKYWQRLVSRHLISQSIFAVMTYADDPRVTRNLVSCVCPTRASELSAQPGFNNADIMADILAKRKSPIIGLLTVC